MSRPSWVFGLISKEGLLGMWGFDLGGKKGFVGASLGTLCANLVSASQSRALQSCKKYRRGQPRWSKGWSTSPVKEDLKNLVLFSLKYKDKGGDMAEVY